MLLSWLGIPHTHTVGSPMRNLLYPKFGKLSPSAGLTGILPPFAVSMLISSTINLPCGACERCFRHTDDLDGAWRLSECHTKGDALFMAVCVIVRTISSTVSSTVAVCGGIDIAGCPSNAAHMLHILVVVSSFFMAYTSLIPYATVGDDGEKWERRWAAVA